MSTLTSETGRRQFSLLNANRVRVPTPRRTLSSTTARTLFDPLPVAPGTGAVALASPAPITVHDDRDVPGNARWGIAAADLRRALFHNLTLGLPEHPQMDIKSFSFSSSTASIFLTCSSVSF